jgi:hypothetical protein
MPVDAFITKSAVGKMHTLLVSGSRLCLLPVAGVFRM